MSNIYDKELLRAESMAKHPSNSKIFSGAKPISAQIPVDPVVANWKQPPVMEQLDKMVKIQIENSLRERMAMDRQEMAAAFYKKAVTEPVFPMTNFLSNQLGGMKEEDTWPFPHISLSDPKYLEGIYAGRRILDSDASGFRKKHGIISLLNTDQIGVCEYDQLMSILSAKKYPDTGIIPPSYGVSQAKLPTSGVNSVTESSTPRRGLRAILGIGIKGMARRFMGKARG